MTDTQPSGAESALDLDKLAEKAAKITIQLAADSGYTAMQEARISAEQWGKICAVIEGADDALARRATAPHAAAQPVEAGSAVQAEPEFQRIAAYWEAQARLGCVDAFECALREVWRVATPPAQPEGWDDSWKVVIGAAAALAQIHIEDEDEREAMMVHVRKIASSLPKLGGRPVGGGALVAKAEPMNERQERAVKCMDAWAIAEGLPTYSSMYAPTESAAAPAGAGDRRAAVLEEAAIAAESLSCSRDDHQHLLRAATAIRALATHQPMGGQ